MSTASTSDPERMVCENCHHVNIVLNTPNKRRVKKDRHVKLDDPSYDLLLLEKIKTGGDIQDVIVNVFFRLQEYERRFGQLFIGKKISPKVVDMASPIMPEEEQIVSQ